MTSSTISGRKLAELVLNRVEGRAAYLNLALPEIFHEHPEAEQRERAFCTELTYGVYRHLYQIDYFLGRLLSRPFDSLKTPVKNVMRIALYQLIYLTDIPARAVCFSAVAQVKNSQYQGLAPLVNGVLRAYLRNKDKLKPPDRSLDLVESLAIEYSHPRWLVERWLKRFGEERTEQILQVNNEEPPLTLRFNQYQGLINHVLDDFDQAGIKYTMGLILPEAIQIKSLSGPLDKLASFQSGKLFVQDESSMLVAHLVDPQPGETIVDLCAAPGGKSTHLAELMGDQGKIWSIDDHPHKIDLIVQNAKRLKLQNICPYLADARNFKIPGGGFADAVLVDAPCTGTGVLRRRVDARYRRQPEDIETLVAIQREILRNASRLVRPGGRLIYSTCTLEPEEDQEQIQWFLSKHPDFETVDFGKFLPEMHVRYLDDPWEKWLTILPISGGGDGFFMCRMERKKA
ncbi:MAG TPA: 16S rRNA (cytosine(967)-C(5))-methyltransferase RsmB [Firmicutes bacterium]|jgi:16S rRNA (cytosine967-C5)-methyltransferase|nr:16S rRNA (cytosine(967)-C(5))-methyltransferase RsmB [Bacillota bacterium]